MIKLSEDNYYMDMFMILSCIIWRYWSHAGLFSNSIDLVKILQLYLNKGEYNSQLIFKANTIIYLLVHLSRKQK